MKNTEGVKKFTGIVEVRPFPGFDVLGGAKGAFVNVLCLTSSPEKFKSLVCSAMSEHHLDVVRMQDVRLIPDDPEEADISRGLEDLSALLSLENPVQFDEFQTFSDE